MELPEEVVFRLERSLGFSKKPIALHEPDFGVTEREAVQACIDSNFASTAGPLISEFESELQRVTGAAEVFAVSSGTAALHLALLAHGVGPDDEVLVPPVSFVATVNAIHYCGATPHFVDVEPNSLGVDPDRLRVYLQRIAVAHNGGLINRVTGRRIRAAIFVHVFGHSCRIVELVDLCEEMNVLVIEDAAEALGSLQGQSHLGTFAPIGVLSFNGNKIITTGAGGAVLFRDASLASLVRHIGSTAKTAHPWRHEHDRVGFNYKMPSLNAALGLAQLGRLPEQLAKKRALLRRYEMAFKDLDEVTMLREPPDCSSNYWLQALVLAHPNREMLEQLLFQTNQAGYMTRPVWRNLAELAPNLSSPRDELPGSAHVEASVLNLPSSPQLMDGSADEV